MSNQIQNPNDKVTRKVILSEAIVSDSSAVILEGASRVSD